MLKNSENNGTEEIGLVTTPLDSWTGSPLFIQLQVLNMDVI